MIIATNALGDGDRPSARLSPTQDNTTTTTKPANRHECVDGDSNP